VHETAADNLAEIFRGSSFLNCGGARKQMATVADRRYNRFVNEPDEIPPKRNYQWPWFVLAAVLLGIVLAILWVSFAARKVEQERDVNAPLPNSSSH
jgi:hypothetical protein